jgi:lipopolysaccharide transport system ATP-binding protein
MSETVIKVENLGKKYLIRHQQSERYVALRDVLTNKFKSFGKGLINLQPHSSNLQHSREEFWALKDISFEVKQGESIGVIGRNGAGKTTLLKLLGRITEPTTGRIAIKGRVASLLEVGTGFHPELTGRENIFLNGAILGMSKAEIRKKFDEIVDFAEMEKFLDTPVKRYSSGMYVRLAFAVAAHLEPEILLVDEVLAVGDVQFQKKCIGKMEEVGKEGRTVLFVSHNTTAVQTLCTLGLLLVGGALEYSGPAGECIAKYLQENDKENGTILALGRCVCDDVCVSRVTINGSESTHVHVDGTSIEIAIQGQASHDVKLDIEARLFTAQGILLGTFCPTRLHGNIGTIKAGNFRLRSLLELPRLNKGRYTLHLLLNHPMVQGYWEFPNAVTLYCDGIPFANGSVLDDAHSGPLLLAGATEYPEF